MRCAFENPKRVEVMGKKITTILRSKCCLTGSMESDSFAYMYFRIEFPYPNEIYVVGPL